MALFCQDHTQSNSTFTSDVQKESTVCVLKRGGGEGRGEKEAPPD